MHITGKYAFDKDVILDKSYDLLCTFFANKEIAFRSNPDDPNAPLIALEQRFFESKVTRLLIEIATLLRVMDDQIQNLPGNDPKKGTYYNVLVAINQTEFGLFQDEQWKFRDICNKIIHSDTFLPSFRDADEGHSTDYAYNEGYDEKSVNWKHFSGYVRLAGKEFKNDWNILLDIEAFIIAIQRLMSGIKWPTQW